MAILLAVLLALIAVQPAVACEVGTQPAGVLDLYLASVAAREAGDHEGAIVALEQARLAVPDDADLAIEMARAYAAARYYGAAAAAYAEAAVLAPTRLDLALEQSRFHLSRAFRVQAAAQAAERAVKIAPKSAEALTLLDLARTAAAAAR